jgi:hypothetical protein
VKNYWPFFDRFNRLGVNCKEGYGRLSTRFLLDKPPEPKGRPSYAIDCSHEEAVRHFIRKANQNGQYVTLSNISEQIRDKEPDARFHRVTTARTLDRWGFEFGFGTRYQHLKEKDEIIALRHKYLRRMKANRDRQGSTIQPEIILPESYVNKNHSNDFIWYSGEDEPLVQKPTGKGERLIIVNAISSNGWVDGAKLVAARKTGDYHGQMKAPLFQKWFKECLIPNIPNNSLIIMDNARFTLIIMDNARFTIHYRLVRHQRLDVKKIGYGIG